MNRESLTKTHMYEIYLKQMTGLKASEIKLIKLVLNLHKLTFSSYIEADHIAFFGTSSSIICMLK